MNSLEHILPGDEWLTSSLSHPGQVCWTSADNHSELYDRSTVMALMKQGKTIGVSQLMPRHLSDSSTEGMEAILLSRIMHGLSYEGKMQ